MRAEDAWPEVYDEAILLVDGLAARLETQLEVYQRDLLAMEDPNEMRRRLAEGPRRAAEKVRADAKAAIQRAHGEWVDRSRRQLEKVSTEALGKLAPSLAVVEGSAATGIELSVDEARWGKAATYVERCADTWTANLVEGADDTMSDYATTAVVGFRSRKGRAAMALPEPRDPTARAARLGQEPAKRVIEIPGFAGALVHSVRSGVMMVGMFAGLAGTALSYFIPKALGEAARPSSATRQGWSERSELAINPQNSV